MDDDAIARRLAEERAEAVSVIESMSRRLAAVVDAAVDEHADDEHDPEGSTLAFERGQLVAQIERSRQRVAEIDDAQSRLVAGTYGVCSVCGGPIADVRLDAVPATRVCIVCAASAGRSRRW